MTPSLPPKASLEQLKNQAKDALKAHKRGDPACCAVLRHLHQFKDKPDDEILKAKVGLQEVQFALAMDYGFKSWAELKERTTGDSEPSPTDWLVLFDGSSLGKWVGAAAGNVDIEGDTLVIRDDPKDQGVRAETGGASWADYVISMDVMITRLMADGHYCVQLTGDGTAIYCQLVPGAVVLAYYDDEKGFTHIGKKERDIPEGTWFNFQMQADHGVVTAIIDGEEVLSADCPRGTDGGFPGLLVNQQKHAEVRIRDIRVRFLYPTDDQLQEYESGASINWLRHKERQKGDAASL
jgi:3-keto-disaccharide hydrolase